MAASKREAGNSSGGHDAGGNGQAKCAARMIQVSLRAARFGANGAQNRIHADSLERAEIDHQTIITAAEAGAVVSAAADCNDEFVITAAVDGGDDLRDVATTRDESRVLVDHAVVECACVFVAGAALVDQLAAERLLQVGNAGAVDHRASPKSREDSGSPPPSAHRTGASTCTADRPIPRPSRRPSFTARPKCMPAYTRDCPFSSAAAENPSNSRVTPGSVRLSALNRTQLPRVAISTSAAAQPATVCVDG